MNGYYDITPNFPEHIAFYSQLPSSLTQYQQRPKTTSSEIASFTGISNNHEMILPLIQPPGIDYER